MRDLWEAARLQIGPKLAHELGYDFVDIDDLIEDHEGVSIARIFEKYGEEYFRNIETKMLADVSESKRNIVVALGGGSLTVEENRILIRKDGILVYLKADPAEILARVDGKQDRPMLLTGDGTNLSGSELHMRIMSLLKEREKHYLEANIIINTSNMNIEESVEQIVSRLTAGFF